MVFGILGSEISWFYLFLVPVTFIGVDGRLTCGGCESNANNTEYYCMGTERHIYFRCESSAAQLIWNVSPLFQAPIVLNGFSSANNIIRRDGVSVVVDTVDFSQSGESQIISYLLINVQEIGSEMNVSCEDTEYQHKTFMPIGEDVMKPTIEQVYVAEDHISEDQMTVYYKWNHANFRTLLCYNIITYHNDVLISNITLPRESVNGSHSLPQNIGEGALHLVIEAVGLCRGISSRTMIVSRHTTTTCGEDCLTSNEIEEHCAAQCPSASTTESASTLDFSSGNIGFIVGLIALAVGIIVAIVTVVIAIILVKRKHGRVSRKTRVHI